MDSLRTLVTIRTERYRQEITGSLRHALAFAYVVDVNTRCPATRARHLSDSVEVFFCLAHEYASSWFTVFSTSSGVR